MRVVRIGVPLEALNESRRTGESFLESMTIKFKPPEDGQPKFIEWSVGCAYLTWVCPDDDDDDDDILT